MKYILSLLAILVAGCSPSSKSPAPAPTDAEKFTFLCITPFGPAIIENKDASVKKYDDAFVYFQPTPLGTTFRIPTSLCARAYEK